MECLRQIAFTLNPHQTIGSKLSYRWGPVNRSLLKTAICCGGKKQAIRAYLCNAANKQEPKVSRRDGSLLSVVENTTVAVCRSTAKVFRQGLFMGGCGAKSTGRAFAAEWRRPEIHVESRREDALSAETPPTVPVT